ncbi:MAG: ATP-binding protein [bacterium]
METSSPLVPLSDSTSASLDTSRRKRRGLSIQLRLVALVVAAALPPVLFSMVQVRAASKEARERAEQVALQLARRITTRVDDHLSVVEASLLTLSQIVRTDANGQASNDALLTSVSNQLGPRFRQVLVADTLGRTIGLSNAAPGFNRPNVGDRKYFRDALTSPTIVVGEVVMGRISHEYTIGIGRVVLGRDGRPRGVVAASTTLEQLRLLLIPLDLPPGAVITLIDEHGIVLARSIEGKKWVSKDVSSLPSIRATMAEGEGVRELSGIDGVTRLSGYATAARVPWHVYVGIPNEIALAQVNERNTRALLLGLASLIASIGLAWLLARRIAGPVIALTSDANAFAAGELAHRSNVNVGGELGQLAATFNRMAFALQRRRNELSESERRYRTLFDTLPMSMWVYDVDSLHYLAVNQAAIDRYGYSREEFLAMTLVDLRPAEDVENFRVTVNDAVGVRMRSRRYRHQTKSGELLEVEISSDDLIDGYGTTRLVVAIDVTERLRTEEALRASQEQLRQSQKMEAVGSLAGGIAHDFNNLLTGILGYCDLALEAIPEGTEANDDVKEIRRAGQRAAELTHQLLAFSRRQMLKPMVFGLNGAVEGTERILRRLISESITLEIDLASPSPFVRADPSQVEQVILNLAVNARDAMPRGGQLILSIAEISLAHERAVVGGTLAAGTYASLTVRDTGTGIPMDIRDRLFEPFFTTKERGRGTGLGLATVYGIVQQSGGGIEVESEVGVGSVFTVYFPSVSGQEEAVVVHRGHQPSARGQGTVLLAEDDDAVRAIARTTLERVGYHVLSACDGPTALALAEAYEAPIHLLLTDVIMPGMNGRELAERLSLQRPGLPVLFVSGYTDNVLADHGLPAMETVLLDKPFTPATLTTAVAALLNATDEEQ